MMFISMRRAKYEAMLLPGALSDCKRAPQWQYGCINNGFGRQVHICYLSCTLESQAFPRSAGTHHEVQERGRTVCDD
jgi:hypothetical protein